MVCTQKLQCCRLLFHLSCILDPTAKMEKRMTTALLRRKMVALRSNTVKLARVRTESFAKLFFRHESLLDHYLPSSYLWDDRPKFWFQFMERSSKNFLRVSRLRVGRQKKTILGYVPKNDEEKNLAGNGLRMDIIKNILNYFRKFWVSKQCLSKYDLFVLL